MLCACSERDEEQGKKKFWRRTYMASLFGYLILYIIQHIILITYFVFRVHDIEASYTFIRAYGQSLRK